MSAETSDDALARCSETLEALAATPEVFFAKGAAHVRLRAAANRLIHQLKLAANARRHGERAAATERSRVANAAAAADRAALFREKRDQTADLAGRVALVTGGRIRIGHETAKKLLRAGARVVVTTRSPADAAARFAAEPDFESWRDRLELQELDLRDRDALERFVERFVATHERLDVLVNNAAQTVSPGGTATRNSWTLELGEVSAVELAAVLSVNVVAPFVLASRLLPLIERTPGEARWVVNVSAIEGTFAQANKAAIHPHTNMAKAALNMLTRTAGPDLARRGVYMVSVDPGWSSLQQPEARAKELEAAGFELPLDAVDGAARILDPVFTDARVGGVLYKDFEPSPW